MTDNPQIRVECSKCGAAVTGIGTSAHQWLERHDQVMHGRKLPVEKVLYSVDDAAEALSVSSKQVRAIIKHGYLPTVRIGRLIRIRRRDLEKLATVDIPSLWPEKPWSDKKDASAA